MMLSIVLIFNRLAISGDSQMYQTIVSVHLSILKRMFKKFPCSDALSKMKVGFGLLIQWVPTGILRHRNMRKLQVPVQVLRKKAHFTNTAKERLQILVRNANLRVSRGDVNYQSLTGHLDEHSRNIIMGHKKGGTFAHYVSVRDDTQSVFMQTPTRNALISLASNASLTQDASVPQELTAARKEAIETDPELQMLIQECTSTHKTLISKFSSIKKAAEVQDMDHKHLKKLQSAIRAKRKRLFRSAMNAQHKEFFDQVGNHIIEKNHQGTPIKYTADVSHIQPERRVLAELEFKNRDADTIDDKELLEDRIQSLELRLELHKLQVPQPMKRLIKFDKADAKVKKYVNQSYPMESQTGLECPVCLGRGIYTPRRSSIGSPGKTRSGGILTTPTSSRLSLRVPVVHATGLGALLPVYHFLDICTIWRNATRYYFDRFGLHRYARRPASLAQLAFFTLLTHSLPGKFEMLKHLYYKEGSLVHM